MTTQAHAGIAGARREAAGLPNGDAPLRLKRYSRPRRTNFDRLDEAFYVASCFAPNSLDRTVTIMLAIRGREALYRVVDGEHGPIRDTNAGLDWWPVYVVKAPQFQEESESQ